MDNQHKKIKGYRDLTKPEIALMNEIKAHGEQAQKLIDRVKNLRAGDNAALNNSPDFKVNGLNQDQLNESGRCLALAKTNLQTGMMWFVRSVALPDSF